MLKRLISFFVISSLACTVFAKAPSSNLLDIRHLLTNDQLTFAIKNPKTGQVRYTKNGVFLKRNGYFYQGEERLQGFAMPDDLISNACKLSDVKPPEAVLPPKASALLSAGLNLDATDTTPSLPFDIANPNSYNYRTNMAFYTHKGKLQSLNLYFVKSLEVNNWMLQIYHNEQFIGTGSLTFDASGEIIMSAGLDKITFTPDSNTDTQTLAIDLQASQYASPYKIVFSKFDGHAEGYSRGDNVDENGYISEQYTNGISLIFSKIAVYANR